MAENILGGRLSIEDGFTSPLDKFANQILGAENGYKKFADGIINSNRKIENSMNQTFNNLEKIANKFVANENKVSNAINNANNKVRQNQEKNIDGLIQRYGKLGEAIKGAYSTGDKVSISNPKGGGSSGNSSSDSLKDFVQSFLQGGIGGIIAKLGLIGAGITAGITVMKTLNNFMEQGFDILNKVTDGLLSPEGIKNAIVESMDFETGRMKLDLFYGDKQKGLTAYQDATYIAQKTYAGERDTVEISAKLGQLGINPSQKQLEKLVDVAGTRPEVQTDHIGLAVKEAVEGRIAMLQMYGINNKNLKKYYDDLKKSDPNEYKGLKGALSKKGAAGDPQKYFNLLTSYIEQSPMNNYAETYAQTVKGKIERMTGVWETMKAEIMGIDVKTGTAKEGGVFATIAEQVDHLKDVLEDGGTANSIQKVGNAFGSAFESLGKAFTKVVTPETIDKVANAIVKIGEALASMVNKFIDSGQLDKLLEKFPDVAQQVISNEVIDATDGTKTKIDFATGHPVDGIGDATTWAMNKLGNILGIKIYDVNPISPVTDKNANTAIDKNSNLTDDQKQSLKDLISSDNVSTYNITIGEIKANSFNEIVKSIQEAAGNRK